MAMARSRRINRPEYWPAFVDVLTNLLLVFIFLLSIFALVQFLLSREITGKDTVLNRLNAQIQELTEMLALEKASKGEVPDNLATRAQELSRYRSDFFGRLREILGDRPDIRIVGDRFVFQSEVLFATGSDEINSQGHDELDKLADAVSELIKEIPEDIQWTLQV